MACAVAVLALGPTHATAQVLPPADAAIERLGFLVGEWEGSGWIEQAPGQRSEFRGTERVERRMGDRLVVVEGSFSAWMGPEQGDVPVHQAFGVFGFDARAGRVTFRTYTARGGAGEAQEAEIGDNRVVWGYRDPRLGTVRYTIEVADGVWHETGHASRDDGATWYPFFEMTLRRR